MTGGYGAAPGSPNAGKSLRSGSSGYGWYDDSTGQPISNDQYMQQATGQYNAQMGAHNNLQDARAGVVNQAADYLRGAGSNPIFGGPASQTDNPMAGGGMGGGPPGGWHPFKGVDTAALQRMAQQRAAPMPPPPPMYGAGPMPGMPQGGSLPPAQNPQSFRGMGAAPPPVGGAPPLPAWGPPPPPPNFGQTGANPMPVQRGGPLPVQGSGGGGPMPVQNANAASGFPQNQGPMPWQRAGGGPSPMQSAGGNQRPSVPAWMNPAWRR